MSLGDSVIEFSPNSYKTKEIGQSLMLLIKEGNAEAVVRDLVLSSHFRKLKSSQFINPTGF
jgi:hypothetical protein